jgi:polysaccharide chain length determinant protein (PEP-CTERM system associated)
MMDQENLSLAEIKAIIVRRRWYLVIPFLVVFAVAVAVALNIPPKYRSSSVILIEDQEIPREYVNSNVSSYADQRLQMITQKITGSTRMLEIINRFNLYEDARRKDTIEEVLASMRKDIKFNTINAEVRDPRSGAAGKATIAFSVSYEGSKPAVVQQVATQLASLYLSENLTVRQKQSDATTKFMEDELKNIQDEIARVDSQIAAYKQRNLNTMPELNQFNMQIQDSLDRDVRMYNEQLRSLREKESQIQAELTYVPTETLNSKKTRLSELRVKLIDMSHHLSDKHPDIIKIKAEIAELTRLLGTDTPENPNGRPDNPQYITLKSQLVSVQTDIASVKRQLDETKQKRDSNYKKIEASPRVEEAYKALTSNRYNLQVKLEELSKKYQSARVASGLEKEQMGERFTLIDAARLPEKPFSPNIPAIILIGFVLALASGGGAAALKEFTDNSVYGIDQLAKSTRVPVLGAIPVIVTDKDRLRATKKRRFVLAGSCATVIVAMVTIHFLVMDLNVFWAKLLRKLVV